MRRYCFIVICIFSFLFINPTELSWQFTINVSMATRTRSFNPRPTPQRQSSVTSQNPPRRTTRSTRSRSHEINDTERTRSGAKDRNTAGRIDAAGVDGTTNNGIQGTGKRTKKVRSKPLEGKQIIMYGSVLDRLLARCTSSYTENFHCFDFSAMFVFRVCKGLT